MVLSEGATMKLYVFHAKSALYAKEIEQTSPSLDIR